MDPRLAAQPRTRPPAPARALVLGSLVVITLLAGCVTPAPDDGTTTITDATGTEVQIADLSRILPTSVDLVEILLELGHGHRIVAVPGWIESSSGCIEVPDGAEDLPRVGRPHVINAEEVLALDPTLVLEKPFPLSPTPLAGQLRRADVDVFVFDNSETLHNLQETYRLVGQILEPVDPEAPANAAAAYAEVARAIDDTSAILDTYRSTHEHHPLRTVFQFPAGILGAAGTSAALLLELAGADDVASAAGVTGYAQVSSETLVDRDPERVVATCTSANSPEVFFDAPKYETTTAARLGPETMRIVDPSLGGLIGPRFPRAVQHVAEWLYPEAFGFVTANVTTTTATTDDGTRLTVDVQDVVAADGPAHLRFLAGDGSDATEPEGTSWTHTYGSAGTYTVRLLIIDSDGRVLEHRAHVEVS